VAGCRQHETESHPRCDLEITECEQINWHSRPPGLTDVAADRQTLTAFESIHDCIDMNANASRVSTATTPKFCIGDLFAVSHPHMEPAAFGAIGPARAWPSRPGLGPPTSGWACRRSAAPCVRGHIERKNDASSPAHGSRKRQ
jgi:hypothetical protein